MDVWLLDIAVDDDVASVTIVSDVVVVEYVVDVGCCVVVDFVCAVSEVVDCVCCVVANVVFMSVSFGVRVEASFGANVVLLVSSIVDVDETLFDGDTVSFIEVSLSVVIDALVGSVDGTEKIQINLIHWPTSIIMNDRRKQ